MTTRSTVAESEVNGPGRQRAEAGQWFRLHSHGKAATISDAGIVKVAVATLDKDVRRVMYEQTLLSQDKFKGEPSLPSSHLLCCLARPDAARLLLMHTLRDLLAKILCIHFRHTVSLGTRCLDVLPPEAINKDEIK